MTTLAASMLLFAGGTGAAGIAGAQIVADPAAPSGQRPTVLLSASGLPQVNIQTPSAAGVSRNSYRSFDVSTAGAILNNARTAASTRLGGLVAGNPWLAGGSARVILNEVNGVAPSQLNGYLEVAGQRAEVVVANPAGIVCNGCGFINATRATLTSGVPLMTDGRLDGYRVSGGAVAVEGAGLDARDADYTHLIARALRINAGVWARELVAVAGAGEVAADSAAVRPLPGSGSAPSIALDVAALGGMYAGKITLIGTEAGLGVRNAGQIGASAGEVSINSAGWIDNAGRIEAATRVDVQAPGSLVSTGALRAGGDLRLSSDARLVVDGTALAGSNLQLAATGSAAPIEAGSASWLVAGLRADDRIGASGAVLFDAAGAMTAHGNVLAGSAITAHAAGLDLRGAQLSAGDIQLHARTGAIDLAGGRVIASDAFAAIAPGELRTAQAGISATQLVLRGSDLLNAGGTLLQLGGGALALQFAGQIDNTGGRIATNGGDTRLGATTLANAGGRIEQAAAGRLEIRADALRGPDGQIATDGLLDIAVGRVDLDRAQTRAGQVNIVAGELGHRDASLVQTGDLPATLTVAGLFDNRGGRIVANGALAVTAGTLHNDNGRIESALASLDLRAAMFANAGGRLFALGGLQLQGGDFLNGDGVAYAGQDARLALAGRLDSAGVIAAGRHLSVSAAAIDGAQASLFAAGLQADGALGNGGGLQLEASSSLAAQGRNLAATSARFAAPRLDLAGSHTSARELAVVAAEADVRAATVVADGLLQVRVGGLLDTRDATLAASRLDIQARAIDNSGGVLVHGGKSPLQLSLPGTFVNRGGRLTSNAAMVVEASDIDNRGGQIVAAQDASLALRATTLDNREGRLAGGGDVTVQAARVDNAGGTITSGGILTGTVAGAFDNRAGVVAGDHGVALTVGDMVNHAGRIESAVGRVALASAAFDNADGSVLAATDLDLRAAGLTNPSGQLYAGRDATIALTGTLAHGGVLGAGRHLSVAAGRIEATPASLVAAGLQRDGTLAGDGMLTLTSRDALAAHGQSLAAGTLSFDAVRLDLQGSEMSARQIALAADAIDLGKADIRATTQLGVRTAGLLTTREASLSAAQLALQASSLDNTGGELRQTGSGDLAIELPGSLVNTHGRIVSNGNALNLVAAAIDNSDGWLVHAGTGTLTVRSAVFDGAAGRIVGNGALDIVAPTLRLDGAATQAARWRLEADILSHRGGTLIQTGDGSSSLHAASVLDNQAGQILASTALTLLSGRLDNRGGAILAADAGSLDVQVSGDVDNRAGGSIHAEGALSLQAERVDNAAGTLAAGRTLAVRATAMTNLGGIVRGDQGVALTTAQLDNGAGRIESALGDVAVRADSLINSAGRIQAAVDLDVRAMDIINPDGLLRAGQDARLALGGSLAHGGVIAAGRDLALTARGIDATAGSIFAAGLQDDGQLKGAGSLMLAAQDGLAAHGRQLAAGDIDLRAASLDLSGSQTAGAAIQLTAQQGDLRARAAELSASGRLAAQAAGLLDTREASVVADQLVLQAAQLDNTHGELHQLGIGDTRIRVTGAFDNARGRLESNALSLSLDAATLGNHEGWIVHAGTGSLAIRTQALTGPAGHIASAGLLDVVAGRVELDGADTRADGLTMTAGSVSHAGGTLSVTGTADARIGVVGLLDNRAGQIVGNGAIVLSAGAVDNRAGVIASTGGQALGLDVAGLLDNRDAGRVLAGGRGKVEARRIDNQGGEISAGGSLALTAMDGVANAAGLVAARDALHVATGALDNAAGTIASVNGELLLDVAGLASNRAGQLAAAHTLTLGAQAVDNTAGTLVASSVDLRLHGGALVNEAGRIVTSGGRDDGALGIVGGAVDNHAGLLQEHGVLTIDTQGADLLNRDTGGQGGIVGAAGLRLRAGRFDNTAGHAGSGERLDLVARALDNGDGVVAAQGQAAIVADTLGNGRGRIESATALAMTVAGTLDNTRGLVRSDGAVDIVADQLINAATRASDMGVEARAIGVTTRVLDNREGALRADDSLRITSSGRIDNAGGLISSLGSLSLLDPNPAGVTLAIGNTRGDVLAGRQLTIQAHSLGGDGHLFSAGDLDLLLGSDFSNTGGLAAGGRASITLPGVLSNDATLGAGGQLRLRAGTLINLAGGELLAGDAVLEAADRQTLINRGLIDAGTVRIDAIVLENLGSGRIYGDRLAIRADLLNNLAEGGVAPVIAARERLDLGVGTLRNEEHALVFSAGDMQIGAALDPSGSAIGRAEAIVNRSATIEALGSLAIAAQRIDNLDTHFSTEVVRVSATPQHAYAFKNGLERYDPSATHFEYRFDDGVRTLVLNDRYDDGRQTRGEWFVEYDFIRIVDETRVLSADPARIVAGGDLAIVGGALLNDKSRIVAGRGLWLDLATLENRAATGDRVTTDIGDVFDYWRDRHPGDDSQGVRREGYKPAPTVETLTLATPVLAEHAAPGGVSTMPGRQAATGLGRAAEGSGTTGLAPRGLAMVEVGSTVGSTVPLATAGIVSVAGDGRPRDPGPATIAADRAPEVVAPGGQRVDVATEVLTASQVPGAGALRLAATPTAPAATPTTVRADSASVGVDVAPAIPVVTGGVVRALVPAFTLPDSSLFLTHPEPGARYLVETDPRFTQTRLWLGSDYMLAALAQDPTALQKRLGDGFYEQRLVREQVAQLTGRRFLEGYADDEAQFAGLMDAGLAYGRAWNLRPGIALTAEQMAALTSDIVWLVETPVTLADGSTQRVLVPQVYARVTPGDIDGAGALLSGATVALAALGDVLNSGTIVGRQQVSLSADSLSNVGGHIAGERVLAAARTDLENIGGRVEAGRELTLSAGRDLSVASTTRSSQTEQGSRMAIDRMATLYVAGGTLTVEAGRDLRFDASEIINAAPTAAGPAGSTRLIAGRNLDFGTVTESSRQDIVWNARNFRREAQEAEIGTTVRTSGDLQLQAAQDLAARAAQITSEQGALSVVAGRDVTIAAGSQRVFLDEASQRTSHGFLSSKTVTTRAVIDKETTVDATLSGDTVSVAAGRDIRVTGSNVVSTAGTTLDAGRDVRIEAGQATSRNSYFERKTESGLMRSGPAGFAIGSRATATDRTNEASSAVASTVGSTDGNVLIQAGGSYIQTGSQVVASSGNIQISGAALSVSEARQTSVEDLQTHFKQSGLTVALKGGMIDVGRALDTSAKGMLDGTHSKSQRLQTLNTYAQWSKLSEMGKAAAKGGSEGGANDALAESGIKLSVSFNSSRSDSSAQTVSNTGAGSTIKAAGNVALMARQEDIAIQGSRVEATGAVGMAAARDVRLVASEETEVRRSRNSSSGYSLGASVGTEKKGLSISLDVAANRGKGSGNADSVVYNNTAVTAGSVIRVESGRDVELTGATLEAPRVALSAERNLTLSSVQDRSTSRAVQQDIGFTGSFTLYGSAPSNASLSISRSTSNSDYLGVHEQTAVRAGTGGFDIVVGAHTALNGALITSDAPAAGNSLVTGTLSTTDLSNRFDASAESRGLTLSSSMFEGKYQTIKSVTGNLMNHGNADAHDQSQTLSAISAGEIVIRDEAAQLARSGLSAQETLENLRRDTSATHRALEKVDVEKLTFEARQEQATNMLAFNTLAAFTDEAYRRAFKDAAKVYKITRGQDNQTIYTEVPADELARLEKGEDGKVHISNNGIFNTLEEASKNALQNSGGYNGTQYLIYFPQSNNMISELMIAGYMKVFDNGIFGLTNATQKNVEYMNQYGDAGLIVSGHSRGGMTVGNAIEYIRSQAVSEEKFKDTEVRFFGSAYNALDAANNLSDLSDGRARVTSQVHFRDFVGTELGGNAATGGTTQEGWTRLADLIYMFIGKETVHNCYGIGDKECRAFWRGGVPSSVLINGSNGEKK